MSRCRWTAVTAETSRTVPRNGGNCTLRRHLADPAVLIIANEDIAQCIHCNPRSSIQLSQGRRTTVTTETSRTASRNGSDRTLRRHLADSAVANIGNEDIPRCVHCNPDRLRKLSRCRWSAVPAETSRTVPRNGGDGALQRYLADLAVASIGNEDIARCVHRYSDRGQLSRRRWASVPAEALAAASDSGDDIAECRLRWKDWATGQHEATAQEHSGALVGPTSEGTASERHGTPSV